MDMPDTAEYKNKKCIAGNKIGSTVASDPTTIWSYKDDELYDDPHKSGQIYDTLVEMVPLLKQQAAAAAAAVLAQTMQRRLELLKPPNSQQQQQQQQRADLITRHQQQPQIYQHNDTTNDETVPPENQTASRPRLSINEQLNTHHTYTKLSPSNKLSQQRTHSNR